MNEISLAELRKLLGVKQETLAAEMGVTQPVISQIENRDDVSIGTLHRYIRALGGELRVQAVVAGMIYEVRL